MDQASSSQALFCVSFQEDAMSDATFSVPEAYRLPGEIHQTEYLLDGEIRHWAGPTRPVLSPVYRDGAPVVLGSFPLLSEDEALAALEAARRAFDHGRGDWPTRSVGERIKCVEQFAFRMRECRDAIVTLLMWEIGKTLADAQKEFDRTLDYLRATIDALKELDRVSSRFVIEQDVMAQIRRAPLGAVLCMGPYNYPLNETFTTLIPALIMGNTVVLKPPRHGVLLYRALLPAFQEAFPAGVVNTIYGAGSQIITPLMASGKVDVLAFIGSSRVADTLKAEHPQPHRLRSVLGLDAKNAGIILPDANLDQAVSECVLGTLSYNGQRCTALKILFVHADIADAFLAKFSAAVSALKCGLPWEPGVQITPLPEMKNVEYQTALIADAATYGGRVVNPDGGTAVDTLMTPAVVYPVDPRSRLYVEEQFGPVVPVCPFTDLAEPLQYVIDSQYGQQVSIFGADSAQMAALIDPLVNQVCRVNINSQCQRGPDSFPFTGRKDSAEGTLSVSDALRVFSIRTLVAAKGTEENKRIITDIVREHRSKFLSTDFIL
jgi:glyceraldehyde-3-phosphate dehydrogenase (NADP+)